MRQNGADSREIASLDEEPDAMGEDQVASRGISWDEVAVRLAAHDQVIGQIKVIESQLPNFGIAIEARIAMITTTINSSISVNPSLAARPSSNGRGAP